MRDLRVVTAALLSAGLFASVAVARTEAPVAHSQFHVELGGALDQPTSGRLLLFATDAKTAIAEAKDGKVEEVDASPFRGTQDSVAAREVSRLALGHGVDIDVDAQAFPAGWSQLPAGDYLVQAVLDVDHNYNYSGRGAGDLVSDVVRMHLPATTTAVLQLNRVLPAHEPWALSPSTPKPLRDALPTARQHTESIDFVSPALSTFWGRPIHMRGWVLLPPGYDAKSATRYPVVYNTHGFGGSVDRFTGSIVSTWSNMVGGELPPMIWVFLDESSATGTHEFADSVNNGPWGHALTTELIPQLESRYRMDGTPNGRFLNGHSSGGWATLWLQTRYPEVFGGTWSTSPDPSDFHDFTGVDLYAPNANVYHRADGSAYPLVRDNGKVLASFETFARLEKVLGEYGGQMGSFDWVFSPRGVDGRPMPMFNRDTGAVDPAVVAYWHDHYDIAHLLQANWPTLKPNLDGKIHVIVGTADTFYLDGAAHKLKAVLDGLGAKSDIRFLPGRTHFDLYKIGDDRSGLMKQIAWEMYALARPGSKLKPVAAP
ncbi:alpha/beta hydrolase-fold protein [Rhodanobacter sp. AS-Z3]|uniref:alpha/beta hydrolase n=1 Tax=Rhodanobacter sp. AS-Z3 TaxID=3031330 RepID=UPI00247A8132|nr:alpha/beta hydrolase-fold protein [Rhodanobacter sp. AS-Z3]WEN13461.1 alpha/beta hydrolase-fold protein [Rhodanobacter sp. AS-Z3]